jgi:hypothetical protein
LAQCRPEGNDLDVCSERIALERRNLLERSGTIAEARASDRRRLARIIRFAQGDDSRGHDLAARALTAMARRDFACGDAKSARSHLEAVCAIGDLDEIAPDARIAFMVLYAVVLCTIGSDCGTASSLFSDAVTLCERYGLSELAVVAVLGRSIEEQMRGDPANALKQMHAVWPLAKRIASPLNYIHVCLRIAELEASLTPRAALSMIEEAQRLIRYRTYEWMCAELLTAEALAAAKDFAAAKVHAEHVVSVAAEEQNCALEGSALLVLAECYADLNAKSTAVEAIKAAIVRLERFGFPLKLLRAYRTAATLTGRSRYERYCNELALLHPA